MSDLSTFVLQRQEKPNEMEQKYFSSPHLQDQLKYVRDLKSDNRNLIYSLQNYTSGTTNIYKVINTYLSRRMKVPEELEDISNDLKLAFKGVPPLKEPIVVYRGKMYDIVDPIDYSYVSTSFFVRPTLDFIGGNCCILQITVSPGSKIIPLATISDYKHEYEILLDRGGQFITTGSRIDTDMKYIYVSYIPQNLNETKMIDEIRDPKDLDEGQLIESVVAYFVQQKANCNRFDELLKYLMKTEQFRLSDLAMEAIKMRVCMLPKQIVEDSLTKNTSPPIFSVKNKILRISKPTSIERFKKWIDRNQDLWNSIEQLICVSNELTELPEQLPPKLILLDCSHNELKKLPDKLPDTLQRLVCSRNELFHLPDLPSTLMYISCDYNHLLELPSLPSSLKELSCENNELTMISALPEGLTTLICNSNKLRQLPTLPDSLKHINCGVNHLPKIPKLPKSLIELDCTNNRISEFLNLPSELKELKCGLNRLKTLPSLPQSLKYLRCHKNLLKTLPTLPLDLKFLDCSNNELEEIPDLPNKLTELECNNNQIINLSDLPITLKKLFCQNNRLYKLPPLPDSLRKLDCSNNSIDILPQLPVKLREINCSNNFIVNVPQSSDRLKVTCENQQIIQSY